MHIVHSKDGTIIASQRSGSGPPLVLVHGGTADYTRWRPVLPQLDQMFTVYAVHRRGRGRSIDTGEYNIQREFEDIAAAHTILREVRALEDSPPFGPERFKNITIPTLLLLGGDSPAEYGDFVRRIDKTLPNSKVVVMPDQQHVAMNTAPELFIAEVVRFLTDKDKIK